MDPGSVIWTLDPTIDLPTEDVSVAPLLVTLGQPDDDGQIYLDLEAEGLVNLVGDDEASQNLARSMAMELLLRSTADAPEVFVVGDLLDPRIVEDFDRASHASDWAAVVTDVRVWVDQTHRAIDTNGWGNGFVGRGADPTHDVLAPLAVVATSAPPPEVLAVLTTYRPSTVGVVVVGPVDAPATTIECHDGLVTISELGLTCAGQSLDALAAADLARLVRETEEPEVALCDPDGATGPSDEQVGPTHGQGDSEGDGTEPAYDVLVRLLGDITIEGGRKGIAPKPTAVIACTARSPPSRSRTRAGASPA